MGMVAIISRHMLHASARGATVMEENFLIHKTNLVGVEF
jgi:hypothetical protein